MIMFLSGDKIIEFISDYIDKSKQVQPNGVDLTVQKIFTFNTYGLIDFDNSERKLPDYSEVPLDGEWYILKQGAYLVRYNEIVEVPHGHVGILLPRSTLMRSGAIIFSALWDAGYKGRGTGMLVVHNPFGIRIKQNARIGQITFIQAERAKQTYNGIYQNEAV